MRTEAQKKAEKRYMEKMQPIQITIQYKTDKEDGKRVKAYLAQAGLSANSYVKALIKSDLDQKGFTID